MKLFIVGAGHVGLVTAVGMARLGHRVLVADIDERKIALLENGTPPIFEPGLEVALLDETAAGRLAFTTRTVPPADVAWSIVTVGTPIEPDGRLSMAQVEAAVRTIAAARGPDHTIIVRSTLPLEGPALLAAIRGGRSDAPALVTNPEFMREGQGLVDFARAGRIVMGWVAPRDRDAAAAALDLYAGVDAPQLVADAASVALIKFASNVFLATKIAYANEVARLCEATGADVSVVTAGIGLDDRIGPAFLNAGPGIGGSCLPEQAVALPAEAERLGVPVPLIEAVHRSNDWHRLSVVARLASLVDAVDGSLVGKRIGVLGLAFKANTDDVRESPALALAALLREAGAVVIGYDPRAEANARCADPALEIASRAVDAAAGADAVMVATEWSEFRSLDWSSIAAVMRGRVVYDTRRVVDVEAVAAAGLVLQRLGVADVERHVRAGEHEMDAAPPG